MGTNYECPSCDVEVRLVFPSRGANSDVRGLLLHQPMIGRRPSQIRHFSALAGGVLSGLTLVAALAVFLVPTLMPVGLFVAAILSVAVLSLPIWAAGVGYALSIEPQDAPARLGRTMRISALSSLVLFLIGALTIWGSIPVGRTIGDALYLTGTVVLLAVAIAVLLVE